MRRTRCVEAGLQELKSELNVEPVGTEFGAFSDRNRSHFGRFLGLDRLRPAMVGYGWTACWSIKLVGPNPWTTIVGQRVGPLACLDQTRWPRGTHYACLRCSSDFLKLFLKENSVVGVSRNAAFVSEFR